VGICNFVKIGFIVFFISETNFNTKLNLILKQSFLQVCCYRVETRIGKNNLFFKDYLEAYLGTRLAQFRGFPPEHTSDRHTISPRRISLPLVPNQDPHR
jgi:hypothetical protein